jgi:hypothetical protein
MSNERPRVNVDLILGISFIIGLAFYKPIGKSIRTNFPIETTDIFTSIGASIAAGLGAVNLMSGYEMINDAFASEK